MEALKVVVTVIHILIAFGLVATVLFQSSKSQGLSGSIAGGAETFFGKNKGKTMDGVLAKLTVVLAILFVITSVSLSLISKAGKAEEIVTPELITEESAEATEVTEEVAVEGTEEATEATEETAEAVEEPVAETEEATEEAAE